MPRSTSKLRRSSAFDAAEGVPSNTLLLASSTSDRKDPAAVSSRMLADLAAASTVTPAAPVSEEAPAVSSLDLLLRFVDDELSSGQHAKPVGHSSSKSDDLILIPEQSAFSPEYASKVQAQERENGDTPNTGQSTDHTCSRVGASCGPSDAVPVEAETAPAPLAEPTVQIEPEARVTGDATSSAHVTFGQAEGACLLAVSAASLRSNVICASRKYGA